MNLTTMGLGVSSSVSARKVVQLEESSSSAQVNLNLTIELPDK